MFILFHFLCQDNVHNSRDLTCNIMGKYENSDEWAKKYT